MSLVCTKRAIIRREGYPIGTPAPCFIRCECGHEIDGAGEGDVTCPTCGIQYDARGFIVDPIEGATRRMADALSVIEKREHAAKGYTHPADQWHVVTRKKYLALDCGRSGAFLVDRTTGEIYNIVGYGKPDMNKKRKADVGNIATADPETLWRKRWNYLR